jgi:uncharacterized protein (DUF1501 family)
MRPPASSNEPHRRFEPLDRRQFLRYLGAGAGAATLGVAACSNETSSGDRAGTPAASGAAEGSQGPAASPAPSTDRVLLVIELMGGNDGVDMLLPHDHGAYWDLRPTIGLDPATLLALDDDFAMPGTLANLHERGLAWVPGVGTPRPDLSHFEAMRRWWEGDPSGENPQATGFFGRLCDVLDVGAPVTGISLGSGPSPALRSRTAVTLALPDASSGGWLLGEDPYVTSVRTGLAALATGGDDPEPLFGVARRGVAQAIDFLDLLRYLPESTAEYPGGALSNQLSLAARLLSAGADVRVLHVPWGDFDTHDGHRYRHDANMAELDGTLHAFFTELEANGIADRVLVATISEFGRRGAENAGGLDHGAASVAFLAGPVNTGVHSEYPSLTNLDDNGDLKATVDMREYYATLAEGWFGIPAGDVLPGGGTAITSVLA